MKNDAWDRPDPSMTDNAYEGILCHRQPVILRPPPQSRSLPTCFACSKTPWNGGDFRRGRDCVGRSQITS